MILALTFKERLTLGPHTKMEGSPHEQRSRNIYGYIDVGVCLPIHVRQASFHAGKRVL